MKLKITILILSSLCVVDLFYNLYLVAQLSKYGRETYAYILDKRERNIKGVMGSYRVVFIRVDSIEDKPSPAEICKSKPLIDSVSAPVFDDIRVHDTYPLRYLSDKAFKLGPLDRNAIIHAGLRSFGGNLLFYCGLAHRAGSR